MEEEPVDKLKEIRNELARNARMNEVFEKYKRNPPKTLRAKVKRL